MRQIEESVGSVIAITTLPVPFAPLSGAHPPLPHHHPHPPIPTLIPTPPPSAERADVSCLLGDLGLLAPKKKGWGLID